MLNTGIIDIPYNYAKKHGVCLYSEGDTLYLAKRGVVALPIIKEIHRLSGRPLPSVEIDNQAFDTLLAQTYSSDGLESQHIATGIEDHPDLLALAEQIPETQDLMDQEENAPIVRLINGLLTEAIRLGASDIHIETFEKKLLVRVRVDGQLREIVQPKKELAPLLVSRIKVMARLDIAEKRIPQDGRISLKLAGREIDVRVSTLPSSHGERVVMRILDKQAGRLNIKHLGLVADDFALLQRLIARPHGILLVTGPTGSGKTTSLYAALTELNDQTRNILTAEDPIEYQIEGIGQTQVNSKVDLTFARSLRAMLRQDPDVVMVGEIRDLETAEIAVQASLTGHLVLSTLHTNTALGAIMRLQDMGIESFLIANALIGVIAQRLVRTLCGHCTQWTEAPASSLPYFADLLASPLLPAETQSKLANLTATGGSVLLPKAMGCERCNNQGYVGRSAIYEIVPITEPLRRSIHNKADELDLESIARQSTRSIQHDGLIKVLHGKTTLEEVLRATIER